MALTSTIPIRRPSEIDDSFNAAADAGSPSGTLAKMMAVRTVVATTNPAPTSRHGTMKARYDADSVATAASTRLPIPTKMTPKPTSQRGGTRLSRTPATGPARSSAPASGAMAAAASHGS